MALRLLLAIIFLSKFLYITAYATEQDSTENWRETVGALRIGYLVEGNAEAQRKSLDVFGFAIEQHIGLPVLFRPAKTLKGLIALQVQRDIHYAIHSAASYATAQTVCKCLELLAVPTDATGADGIFSMLIVPADSPYQSLESTEGTTLAIAKLPSLAGNMLPLAQMQNEGIEPKAHFGSFIEVEDPSKAVLAMKQGRADIAIGWSNMQGDVLRGFQSGTLRQLIEKGQLKRSDIRIIWQSKKIPYGPHAIRVDTPTGLKVLLKQVLNNLKQSDTKAFNMISPRLSGGFVSAKQEDYKPLLEIAAGSN